MPFYHPRLGSDFWRYQVAGEILDVAGDVRLLWIPKSSDTTTATTMDENARTVTWDATVAARLTAQGPVGGVIQSFNGTSQYGTAPDTANLSFTDDVFSMVALANVTNTAAVRQLVAKWDSAATAAEYQFAIAADDTLSLYLRDQSAGVNSRRVSNAAITMGAVKLFGATCTGASAGGSRGNDITLYQDASVVTSTAENNGAYVAMENLAQAVAIGAVSGGNSEYFSGSMGLTLITATALSAKQHLILKDIVNYYYGLSL